MKQKKILEISLQHREECEKAKEFNAEHNFQYIIVDDNSLINYNNLVLFLRYGYVLNIYADKVELRHKNYNSELENID